MVLSRHPITSYNWGLYYIPHECHPWPPLDSGCEAEFLFSILILKVR